MWNVNQKSEAHITQKNSGRTVKEVKEALEAVCEFTSELSRTFNLKTVPRIILRIVGTIMALALFVIYLQGRITAVSFPICCYAICKIVLYIAVLVS
ncbi:hypothetical protein L596_010767 [Steinernema carpocapsae]|uniref:Uncharacterized protein n=1 Tax=Steinernema carpocapsae TaxID=34508 RepID=A0A4U5PJI2_STECR|nr:hypothetical protein L596_010767 [Steinernema carpocapsae]